MTDNDEVLENALLDPASASVDGTSISKDAPSETIKLVKFAETRAATTGSNSNTSGWAGTRPARVKLPGASD